MAGKKKVVKGKKTKNPNSPFWKPVDVGEEVKGKFLCFQTTNLGMAAQLDTKLVGLGTVLGQTFRVIHTKIRPGDDIRIIFTGKAKRTKLFDVFWKGKKVIRPSMFAPAKKEEAAKFFDSLK